MELSNGNVGLKLMVIFILGWNHGVYGQADDNLRLELMPNQAVQEKPVDSNSVFTCVPRGDGAHTVKDIQWFDPNGKVVPNEADRIYSELHPSSNLLLIIKKTERSDAGVYRCTATTLDNNKLEIEFTLKPYVDITWIDVPPTQHPIAGMDGLIKCEVNADPAATINWSKNGHNLKPDDRCKYESNGIRCFPILEADNGIYSCRAVVSATGRVDERTIQVDVYAKPEIEGAQEIYEAIEDNALTLTCNARGKPLPTYTWFDKNNVTLKDRPGYLINVTDGTGTLKINRVSREDSGKITCVARNVAGEDSAVMKVQVIIKPKIIKFVGKTVAEGESVNLQCYVQAEPQPSVEFYNAGTGQSFAVNMDYDKERIRAFSGMEKDSEDPTDAVQLYTLEINKVEHKDDGEYQCIAKNTGGNVKATAHLLVEYVPVFVNKVENVLSWINNAVNLTCETSAIPNATIRWSSEGNAMSGDAETGAIKVDGKQATSILTVVPVSNDYFDRYLCTAKNKLGETAHWITLTQAYAPDEIMQVIFSHKTATTVTIRISGPKNDGGLPVEEFVVDYWRQGEKETDALRRMWSIGPTYILEKLEPNTVYNFRFAAINKVGTGPWTKVESHLLPKKAPPEEPKILNADGGCNSVPYSNMYNLEWEVPQDNGEKIKLFQISYYRVRKDGSEYLRFGEMETREIPHPGKTQYTIENLESGTLYKIEIRAENNIGFSQPNVVCIRTVDDRIQTSTTTLLINDNSVQPQLTMATFPTEIIIVIAVVAFVLIVIAIDITCYATNKCGILMCLCVHMCNKQVPNDKVKEAIMEEGKTKECKDVRKSVEDGRHVDDDEAKDATEETPMIDGKTEKEQEVIRSATGNDTNVAKDSVV